METESLIRRIAAAKGEALSDLVLKGGSVVNVFSHTVDECDIAISEGYIVGLGANYKGNEEINVKNMWVIPGLIDGHVHIESSMLLPSVLAGALLPHGTTTIVADPHEIGNVMGIEGIKFMLEESRSIPFDIYFTAPSCVPATHLETSGAKLDASDLEALRDEPRILGLAEMMNYPGVLAGVPEVIEKLELFKDKIVDGHGPGLMGYDLQAYISAGIRSDHETADYNEGLEKVKSGMMLMIRDGTSARNIEALLPLVNESNARRFCFVSDDLHPHNIVERGHLDSSIRKAVNMGIDPITAVQMATINPSEYFGLKDRGAVAPGLLADMVILDDLKDLSIRQVYKRGVLRFDNGKLIGFKGGKNRDFEVSSFRVAPLKPESFRIEANGKNIRVIELIPGQILTSEVIESVDSEDGLISSDTVKDILKLTVVERHKATGRIGIGFVKGFGLKRGALASSVSHDSHNIISVGVDDEDICRAVKEVKDMGGGMVVSDGGTISAKLPLPVAGLMSMDSLEIVIKQMDNINRSATAMGCSISEPFMSLAFLALPVIPELKLTDKGLVDVNKFRHVSLFVDKGKA